MAEEEKQQAPMPWQENWIEKPIQAVRQTVQKAVEGAKEGKMPWELDWKEKKPVASSKALPMAPEDRFEQVFNALIHQESRGKHKDASGKLITSKVGAKGITQVMPKTGADPGFGITPIQDHTEKEYKRFGRDYLQAMLKEFDGDYEKALAAYNAGAKNVKQAIRKDSRNWKQHLPKPSETLPYISNILGKVNAEKGTVQEGRNGR